MIGDVIYIEAKFQKFWFLKRVGRSVRLTHSYATTPPSMISKRKSTSQFQTKLPKGDVHKKKEIVQDVTLHDLDMSNARPSPQGGRPWFPLTYEPWEVSQINRPTAQKDWN